MEEFHPPRNTQNNTIIIKLREFHPGCITYTVMVSLEEILPKCSLLKKQ